VVTVDTPSDALVKAAINEFGAMPTPPASVLGYRSLSSFGLAGGAAGEAFLVPNAWRFHGALEGPALNDISEQNQRYRISALWLKTIFASGTFDFVSAPITDTISGNSLRNEEFQFHEVAHVVGAGFREKLRLKLFHRSIACALEEWRADSVSFHLMARTRHPDHFGKLIAANLVLRCGVDLQRQRGTQWDSDALAATLSLQELWLAGFLRFSGCGNKISMASLDYADLAAATADYRRKGVEFTEREISGSPDEVKELYGSVDLNPNFLNNLNSVLASAAKTMSPLLREQTSKFVLPMV
jgi:hypothetical protein